LSSALLQYSFWIHYFLKFCGRESEVKGQNITEETLTSDFNEFSKGLSCMILILQ